MSSEWLYGEAAPEKETAKPRRGTWPARLVMVLAAVLAAELIWLFGITPLLPLQMLEIRGLESVDRSWLLGQAGIGPHSSWIAVNAAETERRLSRLYPVESAAVVKEYPDTVKIRLEPRRPVAIALAEMEGRTVPVYLDRHGMIIQIGAEHAELDTPLSLPVLSGFGINNLYPGWQIPSLENLLEKIAAIRSGAPELLRAVSEIRVNPDAWNGYDLVLYPVNGTTRFRLGSGLDEEILRYVILMLDVFNNSDVNAGEVDLRGGTASFAAKEASSG